MLRDLRNRRNTIIHIGFWLVYASFFFYQISSGRRVEQFGWSQIFLDFAFHMFSLMSLSYLNYSFFMPRFLKHRKLGKYLLELLPVFLVFMYLVLLGKQYIIDGFTHEIAWVYSSRFIINVFVSALFLVIFVGLLKFVEDYFELEARKKELENEQLLSELRFLKAQINPHFLFNTLNNLYYLAVNQSPNTPEVILKLSQMMRYLLHDSNHPRVPMSKEIEYMQNYIDLEQMRLTNEVPILFEVKGNVERHRIAPLIFITFLENAFKHGVSSSSKNSWIKINIFIENGSCTYTVSNSKISENSKTVNEKSGIGLQNVTRRLDLSYPDIHELIIEDNNDNYTVTLKLELT